MSTAEDRDTKLIESDKRHIYVIAFFYSLILTIIIGIPAYFYIDVEKDNYRQNALKSLETVYIRCTKKYL